jgi:predicted amino acid racemase
VGNLLDEYSKIVSLQSPFEKTAATYNISTVLVQKSKTNFAEFARELKKNGWQMVYEDDVAQILRRP